MKYLTGKSIINNLYESTMVDDIDEVSDAYRNAYGKELDLDHVPCVKAKDKFLSGWGVADGTSSYQVVLCGSSVEAANLEYGMKRVAKEEGLSNIRRDYNGIIKGNGTVSYKIGVQCPAWGGDPKYKTMVEAIKGETLKEEDKPNLDYRKSEFSKLPLDDGGYGYKLKITSNNGETKWLDITKEELAKIERILTVLE